MPVNRRRIEPGRRIEDIGKQTMDVVLALEAKCKRLHLKARQHRSAAVADAGIAVSPKVRCV
jgi:hypothetical protein